MINNYLYFVPFSRDGKDWVKFGSGTNGRVDQIAGHVGAANWTLIEVGAYGARSIEGVVQRKHAETRDYRFKGEFDGGTEVWPAAELNALKRSAEQEFANVKSNVRRAAEASDSVIELIQNHIRSMSFYEQLSVLDLCAGDGCLTNGLAAEQAVRQVELDFPPTLEGDVPTDAMQHSGDVFAMPDGKWLSDVVVMNPPFSDPNAKSIGGGMKTGKNFYWSFIEKAKQHVKPGGRLIFIAPNSWESAMAKQHRDGIYTVLKYDADFGPHPNASVVEWVAGEFKVIGGRDSRRPEVPAFDVEVLRTGEGRINQFGGIKQTGRLMEIGEEATGRDVLFGGPDAIKTAEWFAENHSAVIHWYGTFASGMGIVMASSARELLNV